MPREFGRIDKVADYLRCELARLIQNEVRDPRVVMANVTDVEVARDFSHAKIFVTFIGMDDEEKIKQGIVGLNGAAGFLRTKVAKDNSMRTTPRLHFVYDTSVRYGARLSQLIDTALADDAQKHQDQ